MKKRVKLLLVDDDPDFVEATKIVLESGAYKVEVAYDGAEAMAKVRKKKPDLIILDIIMPNEDGFKVCKELKSDPALAKIPVIMLTSLSERMRDTVYSVTNGLMLEAEDYIDKPVSPEELLRRVARFLETNAGE